LEGREVWLFGDRELACGAFGPLYPFLRAEVNGFRENGDEISKSLLVFSIDPSGHILFILGR
jgi:hypothetical protein